MAVCLIHHHRGLAVLVRPYNLLCLTHDSAVSYAPRQGREFRDQYISPLDLNQYFARVDPIALGYVNGDHLTGD
jgi:hypothetical protein